MTGVHQADPAGTGPLRRVARSARWILLAAALVCLAVALVLLPVGQWTRALLVQTERLGFWGPFALAAFYVVACVLLIPGSVLTLGAGALFGLLTGTVTVSVGSTLGAAAAFVVGRFVARDWVARKVSANPKFAAIDEAVGREGFKIVLLTRLSPVFPFNVQNYAYGLTQVPLWKYFLASWVGMLPGTVMFVYLGSLAGSLAKLAAGGGRERTAAEWTLYGAGLAATLAVTVLVTRIARRALKQAVPAGPATNAAGEEGP